MWSEYHTLADMQTRDLGERGTGVACVRCAAALDASMVVEMMGQAAVYDRMGESEGLDETGHIEVLQASWDWVSPELGRRWRALVREVEVALWVLYCGAAGVQVAAEDFSEWGLGEEPEWEDEEDYDAMEDLLTDPSVEWV